MNEYGRLRRAVHRYDLAMAGRPLRHPHDLGEAETELVEAAAALAAANGKEPK